MSIEYKSFNFELTFLSMNSNYIRQFSISYREEDIRNCVSMHCWIVKGNVLVS